ncbi:MAG: Cof-type HAD-IIB family hydrolase [Defluviitaleaceae bacterium]|nr:Cof-type HAD-IIB family hydrolase [Defluviitaleaceae bacterium]
MYKLIACDVDGTLMNLDFKVNSDDRNAIMKAQEKGVIVTLCSGRSYRSLKGFAAELGIPPKGSYLVGFNGGTIYDYENLDVVKQEVLDKDAGLKAVEIFKSRGRGVEIVVYINGECILHETDAEYAIKYQKTSQCDWQNTDDIVETAKNLEAMIKIIFIGENSDLKELEAELDGQLGETTDTIFTADYMLEVSPAVCTKANGVKWLCQKYGIDMSEVICIGDNHNDISMLSEAGLGVAVANAVDAARAIADYVTINDCTNGAVAEVIDKFILQSH